MIGESDEKISFPHQLVLTNSQVVNHQLILSCQKLKHIKKYNTGGFLGRLLGPLLKQDCH